MAGKKTSAIDGFIKKAKKWNEEMSLLREILLETDLTETAKWMHPCYMYEESNLIIIQDFKNYCALMFIKGVLMEDPHQLLHPVGQSASSRQLRFTDVKTIEEQKDIIDLYIQEAIRVEKSGEKVPETSLDSLDFPQELLDRFEEDPDYEEAFNKLTPGRQKAYIFHFNKAKKTETRVSRIEKALPDIQKGLGPNGR